MKLGEAVDGPVCSLATADTYVGDIGLYLGGTGDSKSNNSVSNGELYKPNL